MRLTQVGGLLATVIVGAVSLVGCTPKPPSAEPVLQEFVQHLAQGDFAAAAALTDQPAAAQAAWEASFEGMQATGLQADVANLENAEQNSSQNNLATANLNLVWQLPKDRQFAAQSQVVLNKIKDQWLIRWQDAVVNPKLATGQHLELRAVNAARASVISADGVTLLAPGTQYRVLLDASKAPVVAGSATKIQQVLQANGQPSPTGAEIAAAAAGVQGNYSVATVPDLPGRAVAAQLAGVPGVTVNPEATLVHSLPDFAPDIVSRVEKQVQDQLDGASGWQVVTVNDGGAVQTVLDQHEATPSPAVRVSLDTRIQQAAQDAVNRRSEMKAMLVALRPSTGEILAVAQTKKADEDGDIALVGQYPPGSTFKMITATAGMMDQGLTQYSTVPCPGTMDIGHRIVTNYNAFSLGNVPMLKAFAASCNTSFADISSRLNPGQLQEVAKRFGLGVDYEVPGLTTITGSVPVGEELVDRTEAGFGQGKDLASPFGMALVAATAAAGRTPLPQLISGQQTQANEQVEPPTPDAITRLREMMRAVVTQGTAAGMKAGGEVFGKTGEAEIAGGSHAWFAGYRGDIAFATLIVLGGGSESSVAITDSFLTTLDAQGLG